MAHDVPLANGLAPGAPTLDHLVVAAASLDAGAAWLEARLGCRLQPGGRHALMGTHNRLLALAPHHYLELIAIDPDAPTPARRRWFTLDDPATRAAVAERPRLLTWVVRTGNLERVVRALPQPSGAPTEARRGALSWRITLTADGSMPEGGAQPALIQWHDERASPAFSLPPCGCRLRVLSLRTPRPDTVRAVLAALSLSGVPVAVEAGAEVRLQAELETPRGAVRLD